MKIITTYTIPKNTGQDYKEQLKNDRFVQALLKEKQFGELFVDNHLGEIANYRRQMEACSRCNGLSNCCSKQPGYQFSFDENGSSELVLCPYQKEKNRQLAHLENYLICDLSDEALKNDIDQIDLTNENKTYIQMVELVRQFIIEHNRGLYFHGPLGVGKSYLACCITNALAKQGFKVGFANMPKTVSELKSRITEEDYINSFLKKMRRADVLVLDDIGAENLTEYIRDDILFPILDYRMEHKKLTLFTSNCSMNDLKNRFAMTRNSQDETKALRLIERIRTLSVEVPINGTSRRKL